MQKESERRGSKQTGGGLEKISADLSTLESSQVGFKKRPAWMMRATAISQGKNTSLGRGGDTCPPEQDSKGGDLDLERCSLSKCQGAPGRVCRLETRSAPGLGTGQHGGAGA